MWIVFCGNWKDRDDRISIVLPQSLNASVNNLRWPQRVCRLQEAYGVKMFTMCLHPAHSVLHHRQRGRVILCQFCRSQKGNI